MMASHTAVDLKRLHHGHVVIHEVVGCMVKINYPGCRIASLPNRQNKICQHAFSEQIAKYNSCQNFVVCGTFFGMYCIGLPFLVLTRN